MLNNILKLDGAQLVSKNEQKKIKGGKSILENDEGSVGTRCNGVLCPKEYVCIRGNCVGI